jgi:hypothetical protein
LNAVGVDDYVTAGRGVSRGYPEATDRLIESGGHSAAGYLEEGTVARWIDLVDDQHDREEHGNAQDLVSPPDLVAPLPLKIILAEFQYALRLEEHEQNSDRRRRMGDARLLAVDRLQADLNEAMKGRNRDLLGRLGRNNASLLRGWLEPEQVAQLLVRATVTAPFAPYDIKVSDKTRAVAIKQLVSDFDLPESWPQAVRECVESAKKAHTEGFFEGWEWSDLWKGLAVVGGIAAIAAVPFLAAALAPAGLAGATAITAGLAALGPGGMAGGLGVLGLVGAVGGAVAARAATDLLASSPEEVQRAIVLLQASALVRKRLDLDPKADRRYAEFFFMTHMEAEAAADLVRHRRINEAKSAMTRDAERKLIVLRKAIDWMGQKGLAPETLNAGS